MSKTHQTSRMSDALADDRPGEAALEAVRRAYPSLYYNEFTLLLSIARHEDNWKWAPDGNLVYATKTALKESFTDEGWMHMRLAHDSYVPTRWYDPHPASPFYTIPDNVTEEWKNILFSFSIDMEKLESRDAQSDHQLMRQYLQATSAVQGLHMSENDIKTSLSSFHKMCELAKLIKCRLQDLTDAENEKRKLEAPLFMQQGCVVHAAGRASCDTAAVLKIETLRAGDINIRVALLDKSLAGYLMHKCSDLVVVSNGTALKTKSKKEKS